MNQDMETINYIVNGTSLIIQFSREIDDHSCRGIREELNRHLSQYTIKRIVFDFTRTDFMDSSGIGVILSCYRRMHALEGEVVLMGESIKISRLLRISGIYRIIESITGPKTAERK